MTTPPRNVVFAGISAKNIHPNKGANGVSRALDRSSVRCLLGSSGLATLTTPGRSNQCLVLTVAPTGHKGANTPWKRVRLTRGLGASAARRVMKSNGQFRTASSETTFLLADGVAPDAKVVASDRALSGSCPSPSVDG